MSELEIGYGDGSWTREPADPPLPFGARTAGGLDVTLGAPDLDASVHGTCGWVGSNVGWYVERRAGTSHIAMTLERTGDPALAVAEGERRILQHGASELVVELRTARGRVLGSTRLDLYVGASWSDTRPVQITTGTATVLPADVTIEAEERPIIDLGPLEREVMLTFWDRGDRAWTNDDVAQRLGITKKQVEKAVERVAGKVRLWLLPRTPPERELKHAPGLPIGHDLAVWLEERSVI